MRFWRDSEQTVLVRWYFCREGAPLLPYATPFGSRNWHPDNQEGYDGLGEVYGEPRRWSNGLHPGLIPGNHLCGTEEQWRRGEALPPAVSPPQWFGGGLLCCQDQPLGGGVGSGNPLVPVKVQPEDGGGEGGGEPMEFDPMAGAIAWLNPDGLAVYSVSDPVDLWPDHSAAQVDWEEDGVHTAPVVGDSPGGEGFKVAQLGPDYQLQRVGPATVSDYALFVVLYLDYDTFGPGGVYVGQWSPALQRFFLGVDDDVVATRVTLAHLNAALPDSSTGWHLFTARRQAGILTVSEDGAAVIGPVAWGTGVSLARMVGGFGGEGVLAELVAFPQALSDEQWGAVQSYLRTKYGTP